MPSENKYKNNGLEKVASSNQQSRKIGVLKKENKISKNKKPGNEWCESIEFRIFFAHS